MVPFGFFPRPRIRKWCGMELKNAVSASQRNSPVWLPIKSGEFLMQGRVGWQEGKGVGVCADLSRTVSREGTASNNRVGDVYQDQ